MCILKSSGVVGQILQASGNGKKKAVIQILTMDKEWIKKQKQKTKGDGILSKNLLI